MVDSSLSVCFLLEKGIFDTALRRFLRTLLPHFGKEQVHVLAFLKKKSLKRLEEGPFPNMSEYTWTFGIV